MTNKPTIRDLKREQSIAAAWPEYSADEIAAAVDVLKSGKVNYWTGKKVREFELEFAELCEQPYALAVNSGSVALELALHAAGVGPGDEVIVTPRSFIASASSVLRVGAVPVFVDVCRNSQNLTHTTIADAMTPSTKAVLIVHLAGWPCDMDAIEEVCSTRGVLVIEDASQAHGARYKNRPVGSFGHVSVFSFCQDKIISTAGEGGMLLTSDKALYEQAYALRDSGRSPMTVNSADSGLFRYVRNSIGSNYRLTELQAAIGSCQLKKLNVWLEIRRRNADILNAALGQLAAVRVPDCPPHIEHAYYLYFFFLRLERLKTDWSWRRVLSAIRDEQVQCRQGICPEIYLEEGMANARIDGEARLLVAKELGETGLALPVHPGMTPEQVGLMAETVSQVIEQATQ